jgi:hypothetical protein
VFGVWGDVVSARDSVLAWVKWVASLVVIMFLITGLFIFPKTWVVFVPLVVVCAWLWVRDVELYGREAVRSDAHVRHERRTRGQCVACGYDRAGLGEGEACPECGASPAAPGQEG